MSLRDESRKEYLLRGASAHTDELRTGALQRIADAVEKMAQRHTELIRERDYYERLASSRAEGIHRLERSNAALRGVIARMKRAQAAPQEK